MSIRNLIIAAVCLGISFTAMAADFEIKNETEFRKVVPADARIERLATGFKFLEGPVWMASGGGYLIFSDIPANELKKWTKQSGITTFRTPSGRGNGNTYDLEGRLVTCEEGARVITRTEPDGTIATLAERYNGKRLNSPNDLAVKSDGTIWFTDPPYGVDRKLVEQPGNYVYRLDPKSQQIKAVITDLDMPNGICFSPDEKKLYVADSGRPHHIRVFDVRNDGTLSGGTVFCTISPGGPDGIRCDADGRVWSSAGDGVHIFAPDGSMIGKILTPQIPDPRNPGKTLRENPSNLCFGGEDGKTLFITAGTSLYAIRVNVVAAGR